MTKLADSKYHGTGTELILVEGDSASRSVKRLCDPAWQAVLPMQGKPMNATKATWQELWKNNQFADFLGALQMSPTAPPTNDSATLLPVEIPYQRVILLFDQDADGIHSRTLMLLFFHHWLPSLLEAGQIYDAHPPQWRLTAANQNTTFAYSKPHLERLRSRLQEQGLDTLEVHRYRGLSSIEQDFLERLCINPHTRQLTQLTSAHAQRALDTFSAMRLAVKTKRQDL